MPRVFNGFPGNSMCVPARGAFYASYRCSIFVGLLLLGWNARCVCAFYIDGKFYDIVKR